MRPSQTVSGDREWIVIVFVESRMHLYIASTQVSNAVDSSRSEFIDVMIAYWPTDMDWT